MATPVADTYSETSGWPIAGGRLYVSQFYRDLAPGWTELVMSGSKPPNGILAYSGMALNSVGGKIYLHGGGHQDYFGNEVWEADIESFSWLEHYDPDLQSNPLIASARAVTDNDNYPGAIVVSGSPVRPISRHTYKSVKWINSTQKMVAGGASTYSGSGSDYLWYVNESTGAWLNSPKDHWQYDPITETWEYLGSELLDPAYLVSGPVVYHAGRDRLYSASRNINNRLTMREWNPHTNVWTLFSGFASGSVTTTRILCVDTTRDRLLIVSRNSTGDGLAQVWAYNIDANTWEQLASTGAVPANLDGDAQITYSPVTDRILLLRNSTLGLSFYDVATGVWSSESISASVPRLLQVEGRWEFDARRRAALLIYADSINGARCFVYKES